MATDKRMKIPVIEEEVEVGKRRVETGTVRVTKHARERVEQIDEPLMVEQVEVKVVPVGRYVDGPLTAHQDGDVTIVPVVEEVLVVEKRYLLKEEVHLTKTRTERRLVQEVPVRSEEVVVERIRRDPDPA